MSYIFADFRPSPVHFQIQDIGRSYCTSQQNKLRSGCWHFDQEFGNCINFHQCCWSWIRLGELFPQSYGSNTIRWIQGVWYWTWIVSARLSTRKWTFSNLLLIFFSINHTFFPFSFPCVPVQRRGRTRPVFGNQKRIHQITIKSLSSFYDV